MIRDFDNTTSLMKRLKISGRNLEAEALSRKSADWLVSCLTAFSIDTSQFVVVDISAAYGYTTNYLMTRYEDIFTHEGKQQYCLHYMDTQYNPFDIPRVSDLSCFKSQVVLFIADHLVEYFDLPNIVLEMPRAYLFLCVDTVNNPQSLSNMRYYGSTWSRDSAIGYMNALKYTYIDSRESYNDCNSCSCQNMLFKNFND